ncbi:MAG TPA: hypothetical protein VIU43_06065, partial [Nitrosospira sp.]
AIEEKRQHWQERIEAAGEGGKTLFGWLLEQLAARPTWPAGFLRSGFGQYRVRAGENTMSNKACANIRWAWPRARNACYRRSLATKVCN